MENYRTLIPSFLLILFAFLLLSKRSVGQDLLIPLWDKKDIPFRNAKIDEKEYTEDHGNTWIFKVQEPAIEVYLPTKNYATKQAVVVCPGGGYGFLSWNAEGVDVARWFNSFGVAAIVLKSRLPNSNSILNNRERVPFLDVQRAIRLVRYHASEWNIDPSQVGVMGFSAGGHLAASISTKFEGAINEGKEEGKDLINRLSDRPDFSVLVYPVITLTKPYTHMWSRNNLLGNDASESLVEEWSNEKQVTEKTPPTFLVHSQDDKGVPVENSLLYYAALKEHGVPVTMHLYPNGGHGYAFGLNEGGALSRYQDLLRDWVLAMKG